MRGVDQRHQKMTFDFCFGEEQDLIDAIPVRLQRSLPMGYVYGQAVTGLLRVAAWVTPDSYGYSLLNDAGALTLHTTAAEEEGG
ncbi:hypothetical protein NDU88_005181 [Pleurodeles waltl]|uniref:Uncharacterized protein n=1 Tax=Pleurodeles waltl TaxID=8319 RepID=A0AAV7QKF4_PLEWA|nr:hypothetical protein NDU88_005181 [Pleurodeles waltl]